MHSDSRRQVTRSIILLVLMIVSGWFGAVAQPERSSFSRNGQPRYAEIIPLAFGDWAVLESSGLIFIDPQQQQVLNSIYQQTLTRAYRHTVTGDVVMLSIAYGDAQTKEAQVHLPDRCYPAQGFEIRDSWGEELNALVNPIPVHRMVAELGGRREAVTYWIRLGFAIVRGAVEQKLAMIGEGVRGRVADGLIFRVSTVGLDDREGFAAQDRFIREMLQSVSPDHRWLFVGDRS